VAKLAHGPSCPRAMDVQRIIWVVETCAEAILLAALIRRGLAPKYRAFTAYVAFDVISSVGTMFLGDPAHSRSYQIAWMANSVVAVFLQTAVVLELFHRICDHYPGIGRFGRTLVLLLVAAAAVCTLATVFPELRAGEWRGSLLQIVVLFRRLTSTAFAFFLVATAVFFVRFPTALRRNVIRHRRLLALYFTVSACSYMTFILKGDWLSKSGQRGLAFCRCALLPRVDLLVDEGRRSLARTAPCQRWNGVAHVLNTPG